MASVCSFLAFNPEEQQIKFENVIQISKNITDTLRMYSEKLLVL
jgi:hypothetical protein